MPYASTLQRKTSPSICCKHMALMRGAWRRLPGAHANAAPAARACRRHPLYCCCAAYARSCAGLYALRLLHACRLAQRHTWWILAVYGRAAPAPSASENDRLAGGGVRYLAHSFYVDMEAKRRAAQGGRDREGRGRRARPGSLARSCWRWAWQGVGVLAHLCCIHCVCDALHGGAFAPACAFRTPATPATAALFPCARLHRWRGAGCGSLPIARLRRRKATVPLVAGDHYAACARARAMPAGVLASASTPLARASTTSRSWHAACTMIPNYHSFWRLRQSVAVRMLAFISGARARSAPA